MLRKWGLSLAGACLASLVLGQTPASIPRQVKIVQLPLAEYPAMALAAHVWGDVRLEITLKPDESVETVEALSGPPMLRQPAVKFAQQARFRCANCGDGNPFEITVHYVLKESVCPDQIKGSVFPTEHSVGSDVTIEGQPFSFCDPSVTVSRIRTRSLKCIYLWHCGSRP